MLHMTSCATLKECAYFFSHMFEIGYYLFALKSCPTCTCICFRPTRRVKVFAKKGLSVQCEPMIQAKTRPGSPPSHAGNSVAILPLRKGSGCTAMHDSNGGDFSLEFSRS